MQQTLHPIGIFDDLSVDDRNCVATFARHSTFEKGDEILSEGHYNASLFIVLDGLLQARLTVRNGDTLLASIEPGSFFGEISVFDPGPTTAQVSAVTAGALLELTRERLFDMVEKRPAAGAKFLLRFMREIARRARTTDERLGDALLLNLLVGESDPNP